MTTPESPLPGPFPTSEPLRSDVKEVRLALVLVGGVSLAIYMHGVTLELHKLVRASHAIEAFLQLHPTTVVKARKDIIIPPGAYPGKWDTEDIYIEALLGLTSRERRRLAVVVDIIGGTSAGGINGVVLGSALAFNRSQDHVKQLWIEEGGIERLVRRPSDSNARAHLFNGLMDHVSPFLHNGVLSSVTSLFASALKLPLDTTKALLHGPNFSVKLFKAFLDMEAAPSTSLSTLVPTDETLELLVTTTSVRGLVGPIFSTEATGIQGVTYRQVMRFVQSGDGTTSHFTPRFTGALSFAARVTSSFPGAFPPTSLKRFSEDVIAWKEEFAHKVTFTAPTSASPPFEFGSRSGPPVTGTASDLMEYYMDGGVCDNYPFDIVIDAVRQKPASRQVSRELIYLEPDPRVEREPLDEAHKNAPTIFEAVRKALATIPSHVDLQNALADLEEINDQIAQVGQTTEDLMTTLTEEQDGAHDDPPAPHTSRHTAAVYHDLRLVEEGKHFGATVATILGFPRKSAAHIAIVRAFSSISTLRQLGKVPEPQIAYKLRHAEFALQGLNDALSATSTIEIRDALVATKAACWAWKVNFGQIGKTAVDGALLHHSFASLHIEASIQAAAPQLWLNYAVALSSATLPDIVEPPELDRAEHPLLRTRLRSRFARFTEWDEILFPILALSRIPALKPIHLRRFSPLDTSFLFGPDDRAVDQHRSGTRNEDEANVKGVSAFHFGAFLKKEWRENDYLVGRLDGVELILKLLTDQANRGVAKATEEEEEKEEDLQRDQAFRAFDRIIKAEGEGEGKLDKTLLEMMKSRIDTKRNEAQ